MTDAWRGLISPTEFSDCIGAIYDCTIDPDLWPRALERIGGLVHGASGVILMLEAPPGGELSQPAMRLHRSWNVDVASAQEFETSYAADNPLARLFPAFDLDEPYNVPMVMDPGEWESTRIFKEFARPRGYRDSLGVYLMKSARRAASLSIATTIEKDYCGPRELAIMRLIAPHARRALAISELVDMQSIVAEGAQSALDTLAPGVVLLDSDGRVLFANKSIVQSPPGFPLTIGPGDRFELKDRHAEAAIRRMLRGGEGTPPGSTVAVTGPEGRPIFIHAMQVDEDDLRARIAPMARLALFVSPLAPTAELSREAWTDGFGLTPTELVVLQKLLAGSTPEAIAASMAVGIATVRTHLSRLFAKTGTERQSDLVRLAAMLEPPLRRTPHTQ